MLPINLPPFSDITRRPCVESWLLLLFAQVSREKGTHFIPARHRRLPAAIPTANEAMPLRCGRIQLPNMLICSSKRHLKNPQKHKQDNLNAQQGTALKICSHHTQVDATFVRQATARNPSSQKSSVHLGALRNQRTVLGSERRSRSFL